jgi:hypothetical protein
MIKMLVRSEKAARNLTFSREKSHDPAYENLPIFDKSNVSMFNISLVKNELKGHGQKTPTVLL